MKNPPSLDEVTEKVREIVEASVDQDAPLPIDQPLMASLGLDSLDLIESSFAIQEFFEFELSDRDALETLDQALGGGVIVAQGKLTPLGREMALARMPELKDQDLPENLSPLGLQNYLTVQSFGRLIHQFYRAVPDHCPETGEALVCRNFAIELAESKTPFPAPRGDALLDAWIATTVDKLRSENRIP